MTLVSKKNKSKMRRQDRTQGSTRSTILCVVLLALVATGTTSCALFIDDNFTDGLEDHTVLEPSAIFQITIDNHRPEQAYATARQDGTLVIYHWFQALHMADAWLRSDREGEIWLKAYEVSTGQALSADDIRSATLTRVDKIEDADPEVVRRIEIPDFYAYEGDFGETYFARIELWFESDQGDLSMLSDRIIEFEGFQH